MSGVSYVAAYIIEIELISSLILKRQHKVTVKFSTVTKPYNNSCTQLLKFILCTV